MNQGQQWKTVFFQNYSFLNALPLQFHCTYLQCNDMITTTHFKHSKTLIFRKIIPLILIFWLLLTKGKALKLLCYNHSIKTNLWLQYDSRKIEIWCSIFNICYGNEFSNVFDYIILMCFLSFFLGKLIVDYKMSTKQIVL